MRRSVSTLRGVEAHVDRQQLRQTAQHQAGSGEQHERERHLDDDEQSASARTRGRSLPCDRASPSLSASESDDRVARSAGARPNNKPTASTIAPVNASAAQSRRINAKLTAPSVDLPTRAVIAGLTLLSARAPAQAIARPTAPPITDEQHALGEQQTHEPAAARADRHSHRDLAASSARASELQVRDVDARDEQHESHGAEQNEQRPLDQRSNARVVERHRMRRPRGTPAKLSGNASAIALAEHDHRCLGLLRRDARLAPRHDCEKVRLRLRQVARGLRGHRNEKLAPGPTSPRSSEARRR